VNEQGFVNFRQALEDCRIGGLVLARFDEGPNDEKAHLYCLGTIQDRGGHQSAMLSKCEWEILPVAAPSGL